MTSTSTGIGIRPEPASTTAPPLRQAPRLALAAWLLAPGLLYLLASEVSRLGLVLCPFRLVTHLPCPGCGMTRALLALSRGDLHAALLFHPLSPLVAALLLAAWLNKIASLRGRPAPVKTPAWALRLSWLLVIAALALWAARLTGYLGAPP